MTTQHTPGPWLWRWKDNSLRQAGDGNPYEYTAEVVLRLAEDAEVSDADERLIAAAPDLLAALKQIVFDWDGEPEDMFAARAAITKATATTPG